MTTRSLVVVTISILFGLPIVSAHQSRNHYLITELPSNLSCYSCSTFDDQNCRTINATSDDPLHVPKRQCAPEEKYCSVTRVEYITGDSKKRTFWALERSCSQSCIDGCIVLGERTKLHLCSSCCTKNFCNVNNGGFSGFSLLTVNLFISPLLLVPSLFYVSSMSKV